eukprot:899460_1
MDSVMKFMRYGAKKEANTQNTLKEDSRKRKHEEIDPNPNEFQRHKKRRLNKPLHTLNSFKANTTVAESNTNNNDNEDDDVANNNSNTIENTTKKEEDDISSEDESSSDDDILITNMKRHFKMKQS